ncbi:DUF2846 domain-containing protein [Burkholderia sp. PU8-34]
MQLKKSIPLGVSFLILAGCASVPMGDPQRDAELKTFKTPQEKAAIYVYRNESMGGAIKMPVTLDGKILGDTAAKTYLYSEVEPGRHQLVSKAENDSTLDVDTVAGKIYYVWQEVKMGIMYARSKLQLVDDTTGQDGVKESKLAVLKSEQAEAAK